MNKQEKNELIELLLNEDFKKWVLEPTYERDVFWSKWLENNPDKQGITDTAREFIRSTHYNTFPLKPDDKSEILSNIIKHTPPGNKPTLSSPYQQSQRRWLITFRTFGVAAALVALVAFVSLLWWYKVNVNDQEVATELTFTKYETPQGRKSKVTLPDGTKVVLNSGSVLTYSSNYNGADRTVRVIGEAFFEVKKDASKPFRVITGDFVTTALGTSFNVRAIDSEPVLKITLLTGKVKVGNLTGSNSASGHILDPGEGISISKINNGAIEKFKVDPLLAYGWKDGILVFKGNSMDEVIVALERWYNVNINITGQPKKKWRIDGKFDNESLEQVLLGLSFTYDLEFKITEKNVELKF